STCSQEGKAPFRGLGVFFGGSWGAFGGLFHFHHFWVLSAMPIILIFASSAALDLPMMQLVYIPY
ncbi:hypothetical protein, partial [Segatella buccae]|uniref:hypothetical protein n=1 Tax=Segatella buccae TaxID=28126 RepID=UPI0028D82A7C